MNEVKEPNKRPIYRFYAIILAALIIFNFILTPLLVKSQVTEVDYSTFINMLDEGQLDTVQVKANEIFFTAQSDGTQIEQVYSTTTFEDPSLVDRLLTAGVKFGSVAPQETNPWVALILGWVIPIIIFIIIGQYLSKRLQGGSGGGGLGGAMSFGKSNAKVYVPSSSGITFNDVAGEEEAKELLTEIVDFLQYGDKYTQIGAKLPKGALLVGPPGTGKTMLAKAVAGEAQVPFFSISGSEFVEMFVGMGAAKVRDLFKQANEKAPCIVFIDEIDAIGKKRDSQGLGGNDEREQTLNQLLTEMDGFDASKGVVILAATNRPEILDPALLRPGRFDRRIPVEIPDLIGREAILRVHAKNVKVDDAVDFNAIARSATGMSGAELANIINEAALHAVRFKRELVNQKDLEESIEVVAAGYQKKNKILTDHEREIVSYHEIGHALVAALQSHSAPVQKITIIPRTSGALGYTMQVEEEEHNLMSKEELENKIATFTGGRVAEELIFGSITTGASNDIEQATRLARAMVTRFGMDDEIGMVALETVNSPYLGGDTSLACSAETSAKIDKVVIEIVQKQYAKAKKLLSSNKDKLDELALFLLKEETITGKEFMDILKQEKIEA